MTRTRPLRLLTIALLALMLALPTSAMALAGGSTGSSGGGGGGGFSGGSSSSGSSFSGGSSSSSFSSGGSTTGGGGAAAGIIVMTVFGLFFTAMVVGTIFIIKRTAAGARPTAGAGTVNGPVGNPFRRRQRAAAVETAARTADLHDQYWDPDRLKQRVTECFYPIQWSWEQRSVEGSRPYVSDALYDRHALQLDGLERQGRRNRIADLGLREVSIVRLHDVTNDGEDRFVAYVACSARDWVEDVRTGAVVNGNAHAPTYFEQYWSFARDAERGWVLDEIQQITEGDYHESAPIVTEDGAAPPAPA